MGLFDFYLPTGWKVLSYRKFTVDFKNPFLTKFDIAVFSQFSYKVGYRHITHV